MWLQQNIPQNYAYCGKYKKKYGQRRILSVTPKSDQSKIIRQEKEGNLIESQTDGRNEEKGPIRQIKNDEEKTPHLNQNINCYHNSNHNRKLYQKSSESLIQNSIKNSKHSIKINNK